MAQTLNNTRSLKDVEDKIKEGKILAAIDVASEIISKNGNIRNLDFLRQQRQDYAYMLNYAMTGNKDPGRGLLVSDVVANIYGLVSEVMFDNGSLTSSSTLPSLRRLDKVQNISLQSLLNELRDVENIISLTRETEEYQIDLMRQRENLLQRIFEKVIAIDFTDLRTLKLAEKAAVDKETSFEESALILAALYLPFSYIFNRYKFLTILNIIENTNDERLRERAFVSMFLILCQWHAKIKEDKRLERVLEEWTDSLLNYNTLCEVVKSFIVTLDTKRVNERMKNEIMPGLQAIQPGMMKAMRDKISEDNTFDPEGNPEWEELLNKSGVAEKLAEFQEMQSEGADLMMMPLAPLKNTPFFNTLSNWFLPFNSEHSSLETLRELESPIFGMMFQQETGMCHTDRFSLGISLNNMPLVQKKMMLGMLKANEAELTEEIKSQMLDKSYLKKSGDYGNRMEIVRYLRDLYRFYNLYKRKDDFYNPFSSTDEFLNIGILKKWFDQPEMKQFLGEFFFKHGYYKEALCIYNTLAEDNEPEDGYIWQKIGYCHQRLNEYSQALQAYSKAEFFHASDSWIIRNQAKCYENLGDFKSAAKLYRQCLLDDIDNRKILERYAACSFGINEEENVMPLAYKFEYEHPGSIDELLIVGELLTGKSDSADSRIDRFMLTHEQTENHHLTWFIFKMVQGMASNNLPLALESMNKAMAIKGGDLQKIEKMLAKWGLLPRFSANLRLLQEVAYFRKNP